MSDVFDAMRDDYDALAFDEPVAGRIYMLDCSIALWAGSRMRHGIMYVRHGYRIRSHENKYHRHKKRPNGRGRGR